MKLRIWQQECIDQAMMEYQAGHSHFLCLATPGAGKTLMASRLAKQLKAKGLIDLVICIAPSVIISEDFKEELEIQLGQKLDGKIGSIGKCMTYQAMLSEIAIWRLFEYYKVFVIFDEIHHCSGDDTSNSNAWGQKIISEIQGKATFTLALTGTPWRSDCFPITLANYTDKGEVHCNYSYGLTQAITDNVCRTPIINLIDNDKVTFTQSNNSTQFNSFDALFKESDCSYQSLIESKILIKHILDVADSKLNTLRKNDFKSGGLIVAASIAHAKIIQQILAKELNEHADLVTYAEPEPTTLIKQYKHSNTKWIISVGMISEGTNIPRLKVCCYLTRVKTELYFRQVLGRILRAGKRNENGYFYMPAEPTLVEYAYRVNEDVPKVNIINLDNDLTKTSNLSNLNIKNPPHYSTEKPTKKMHDIVISNSFKNQNLSSKLSKYYEYNLGLLGQFEQIECSIYDSL